MHYTWAAVKYSNYLLQSRMQHGSTSAQLPLLLSFAAGGTGVLDSSTSAADTLLCCTARSQSAVAAGSTLRWAISRVCPCSAGPLDSIDCLQEGITLLDC